MRLRRAPDLTIGGKADPYLERWYVIPQNRWFNVYLHRFLRDDDDRALHDHPWGNMSFVLGVGYREVTPHGAFVRQRFSVIFRRADQPHRVECLRDAAGNRLPCLTLFVTLRHVRQWGFHCPKGWVHWRQFTSGPNGETVGRGCAGME